MHTLRRQTGLGTKTGPGQVGDDERRWEQAGAFPGPPGTGPRGRSLTLDDANLARGRVAMSA